MLFDKLTCAHLKLHVQQRWAILSKLCVVIAVYVFENIYVGLQKVNMNSILLWATQVNYRRKISMRKGVWGKREYVNCQPVKAWDLRVLGVFVIQQGYHLRLKQSVNYQEHLFRWSTFTKIS